MKLNRLLNDETACTPEWHASGPRGWTNALLALWQEVKALVIRYVICRGNKVDYLRYLGARIGRDCLIVTKVTNFDSEPWLIEIGDRVSIADGVKLITHDGASRLFRHQLPGSCQWGNRFGTIQIHSNSFIGANALILPDIQIGPNSIVGAGSLVNKDVPPETVVAGVPARAIHSLNTYIEHYQKKMIPVRAVTRAKLRRELTRQLWGEER